MSKKPLEQLSGETSLRKAARAILRSRLRSVSRLLKEVSAGCVRKSEYVHQLRVSIRRAEAAISAFELSLKPKAVTRIRKRLKTVRKAAGAVRDCDVHASLSKPIAHTDQIEQRYLAKYLSRRLKADRKLAGKALIAVSRRRHLRKLKQARRKLLALAPESAEQAPTLRDGALQTLTQVCQATRAAGAADLHDLVNLHALRVNGKQVRYAVEVFRACVPTEVCESTLSHLRELQALLGRVNDARQMAVWLAEESRSLATAKKHRGVPRSATPELIYEELRLMLGRFEAELDAAHAAALPQVGDKLNAALKPLEDWIATPATSPSEIEPPAERAPAGRTAEGTAIRHDHPQHRRVATIKS